MSEDIVSQIMTACLSKEDLEALWSGNADNTITDEAKLTLYWYHHLRHTPLTCLHCLADREILPKKILIVTKIPLCAASAFATGHRRSWLTKSKSNNPIRQSHHNAPGRSTSCDHVISHQPGLIPQSSDIDNNEQIWGSVLYVDHHSDFVYNHLITGTTSSATVESMQVYERIAAS